MRINSIVTFFATALAAAAFAFSVSSCAKAEPEDSTKLEKMALDAWMQKYVLDRGVHAVEQSNGMYVEFIEDGDQTIDSSSDTIVWLRLDYTSTDLQNNVFATRDSVRALRQGTYTPRTYYVPEYVSNVYNDGMAEGQYFALLNELTKPDGSQMKLSTGSHVRLYMPSYMAYGTNGYSDDQGYGGQFELGKTKIVIQDLTVREVVKNPLDREETLVTRHATERWGLAETDTVATLLFLDTLHFRPRAELLARFPDKPWREEYKLGVDSVAKIWFVGRFLPSGEYPEGFIFDTNIESVWEEFYNRRKNEGYGVGSKSHSVLSYTIYAEDSKSSNGLIPAFDKVIPTLRRGQWSRIVFTSAYGYGATGQSAKLKEQQEYYQQVSNYYYSASMYNNMYSSGYYDNYGYNSYYGYGGYGGGYGYYDNSLSTAEDEEPTIVTEIQSYTPLVFELYIEDDDEDDEGE